MSVLQCSNIHFESTANTRLQYDGSNSFLMVAAGQTIATVNTSGVAFTNTNLTLANVTSTTNTFTVGTAVYFVANGNLGIGNSAPANKLSVNGTGYFGANVTVATSVIANVFQIAGADVYIESQGIRSKTGSGNFSYRVIPGNGSDANAGIVQFVNHAENAQWGYIYHNSAAMGVVSNISGVPLHLGTNSTAKMVITATGNVGIGTLTPGYILSTVDDSVATRIQIKNTANNTSGIYLLTTNTAGGVTSDCTIRASGNNMSFFTAGANERLFIAANGNIGVACTAPATSLEVYGKIRCPADTAVGYFDIGGFGSYISRNAGDGATYFNYAQSHLYFKFGGSDKIMFAANGNVGIGRTDPSYMLDVVGYTRSLNSSDEGFVSTSDNIGRDFLVGKSSLACMLGYAGTAAMVQGGVFALNDVKNLSLQPYGGDVGIGMTSSITDKLTVNGSGKFIGQLDSTTVSTAGFGLRVRAQSDNSTNKIQFTNNGATTDWGYFGATGQNKLFWRLASGYETVDGYAGFSINGGCVLINKVDSDGTDTSDWPTPALAIKNYDGDFHGITMIMMGAKNDELTYETGSAKWNFRLWNDAGTTWTTSNANTSCELKGPGEYRIQAGSSAGVVLGKGATSWSAWSDETMKDIIEPITNALDKVSNIRTVIGKYKTDDETVRRAMLIAQDVQSVLPEAVYTSILREEVDPENPMKVLKQSEKLTLAYTETIPLLLAAIKELKTELDSAKTRISELEAK